MNYKGQAMLGNKVSPASLCSSEPSLPSYPSEGMLGEESQPSQASLFSGEANSIELFSQPQSQGHSGCSGASQEDGRAVPAVRTATLGSAHAYSQGSQGSSGRKYYMKYLSSAPLSAGKPEGNTPLVSDGRVGGTACSRAAFETWKSKQQERLENKQIIDGVIQTTKDIAKELSQTLESLRAEVMEAISSPKQKEEQSGLSDPQLHTLLLQLLQGQADTRREVAGIRQGQTGIRQGQTGIREELAGIGREVAGIRQEVTQLQRQQALQQEQLQSLATRLSAMADGPLAALPSAMQEHRRASDALRQRLEHCVARIEAVAERTVESHSKTAVTGSGNDGAMKGVDSRVGSMSSDLRPYDQAVPSPSKPCEPSTTSDSLYDDSSAGKRTHKRARTVEDNSSVNPSSTALPAAPRVEPPPTSQDSGSTLYDIDLTQESPSLCSQIISQHLEQCSGGGRAVAGARRLGRSQWAVDAGLLDPTTPGRKRKKTELARGRGGRRGRTRQKAVARTPVPRRRSQRIHDFSCAPLGGGRTGGGGHLRRVKQRAGGRGGVQESPVNALNDSFYTQSQAARTQPPAVVPGDSTGLDWSQEGHSQPAIICSTTASGRVQRSSEAARRRLAISHRMMAGMLESDPVLQEISASLRSQQLPERPPNTKKT